MGEFRLGAGHFDLGGELTRLLRLDRPFDGGERLTGLHPVAGLDQHAADLAPLARDADRHVAAGGERARRRDGARDLLAAGHNDGDGRKRLGALAGSGSRDRVLAAGEGEYRRDHEDRRDEEPDNDPPALAPLGEHDLIQHLALESPAAPSRRFEIHGPHLSTPLGGRAACRLLY